MNVTSNFPAGPPGGPGWKISATILNYRHSQRRRVSIFFHTIPGFASRARLFPRIATYCPPPGGGGFEEECTGTHLRGGGDPLPGPHHPWRYPHGPPHGEIPGSNRVRAHTPLSRETGARGAPGHGFPLGIALTAPAPRGGGGGRRPGGVGGAGEAYGYATCEGRAGWGLPKKRTGIPLRSAGGVGVAREELLGTILPGEGVSPSPVPSPRGDTHHGPVYRDKPGKPGSGPLLPRETAASTIPVEGAGRSAKRGRGGMPEKNIRVPTGVKRGRGGGTEGSALWGMGRRPDRVCSSGIDALVAGKSGSSRTRRRIAWRKRSLFDRRRQTLWKRVSWLTARRSSI